MGISDADSAEHGSDSKNIVITAAVCSVPDRSPGTPNLSGRAVVRIAPGSLARSIYQRDEVEEEYFCNYEVNPEYEARFQAANLTIVARGPQGEVRAVEIPGRRFFLATLFQPQLSSTPDRPHPVVLAFLKAAARFQEDREAANMRLKAGA